jgi:hypothetical protein
VPEIHSSARVAVFIVKFPGRKFSDEELYAIDAANEDLRIEMNAEGDFEIMPRLSRKRAKNIASTHSFGIGRRRIKPEFALNRRRNSRCQKARNECRRGLDYKRRYFARRKKSA